MLVTVGNLIPEPNFTEQPPIYLLVKFCERGKKDVMLPVFFCRLRACYDIGRYFAKNRFRVIDKNNLQFSSRLAKIMPPKRRAPAAKADPENQVDLAAGGDQLEPPATKTRKGKEKKEETETKPPKKQVPAKGSGKEKDAPEPEKKRAGRGRKVAAVVEEQSVDTEPVEDDITETKVTKRRGKKDDQSNGVTKEKSSRKKRDEPPSDEPKAKGRKRADKEEKEDKEKKAPKAGPSNSTSTNWDNIDFRSTKKNGEGQKANLKISCWNIGGLKSWVKKDCMKYLEYEDPDIFCIQETKCNEKKLPEEIKELADYKQYWCASDKEGYAGVGLLTKREPLKVSYGINVPELDEDGRCITAEYKEYYVVCVYVPNAGRKLVTLPKRLEWNKAFKDYIKALDDKKPVIICGDMNVAHNEIDLARPANNTKNAGFTQEERDGMTDFLQDGYIDTFRKLYPEKTDSYSFWTYMANARSKNIGWRVDYILVSERIMDKVCDSVIRSEVLGSDHCPLNLFINI